MENNKIIENVKKQIASSDLKIREIIKGVTLIYIDDLVDKFSLSETVIKPLLKTKSTKNLDKKIECIEKEYITKNEILDSLSSGNGIVFYKDKIIKIGAKKVNERAISEPPTSTVIKGPREGFNETLTTNVALIRKRLKTSSLSIKKFNIGTITKTQVAVCFIKGIANKTIINEVLKRLKNIDTEAILDSSYIAKFLGEHTNSLFKQVGNTEKPDILVSKILEGRIAIIVDGSPIVLTVPYLLIEDFQSPSDYYTTHYFSNFARSLRFISVFISLLLPSLYVSAELFHIGIIPLTFLLTIENGIKGIPLSPSYEMFFTLLIFEILNEASVRMPKYVGMVVSIVGGLVLGETAVNAGIISAPTLMIVAFSGICLYTVPELEKTFSIIRLLFLVVAGSIGMFGLLTAICILLVYLISFENFETPLLAPFTPIVKEDLADALIKRANTPFKPKPQSFI